MTFTVPAGAAFSVGHLIQLLGLRLVEHAFAVLGSVEPGLADVLDGDVEAVILAVDPQPDETDQGSVHSQLPEQPVAEPVLQIGAVGVEVVEAELVQPVVALALVVFAKVELEAVTVAVLVARHGGEAGVALGGKGYLLQGLPVDGDAGFVFRLFQRVRPQIVPVLLGDGDVDAVDAVNAEQAVVDAVRVLPTPGRGLPALCCVGWVLGRVFRHLAGRFAFALGRIGACRFAVPGAPVRAVALAPIVGALSAGSQRQQQREDQTGSQQPPIVSFHGNPSHFAFLGLS